MFELKQLLTDLGVQCTPELLSEIVLKYDVQRKDNKDALNEIIDYVCHMNGITYEQLTDKTRKQSIVQARRELIWVLHKLGYKKVTIAYVLKCDHSTILHHLADLDDKFNIQPKEKALIIDKYKMIINKSKYIDSVKEMECKYVYKYPRPTYIRKSNLERI
jgi:chromosomal replication initiation ATPase DnaA